MLLKRKAGHQKIEVFVNLRENPSSHTPDILTNKMPELFIGGVSYGKVKLSSEGIARLNDNQVAALLAQVSQSSLSVQFRVGKHRWILSDFGMTQVLKQMDKVQGFTGTKAALIQKGTKPVPTTTYTYPQLADKPLSLSFEKATTMTRQSKNGQKLIKLLRSPKNQAYQEIFSGCTVLATDKELSQFNNVDADDVNFSVISVAQDKKLVLGECLSGSRDMGQGAWLVNNDFTKIHQSIGDAITDIKNNQLSVERRAEGFGCFEYETWTWDGERFVQTYVGDSGQCYGFLGGGRGRYHTK